MKVLSAPFTPMKVLDKQSYICDLLDIEGPLLCLFRDAKQNWLYLWCDTDGAKRERWLLFPVTRAALIQYLERKLTLRSVVTESTSKFLLDVTLNTEAVNPSALAVDTTMHRRLKSVELADVVEYLPSEDSFFNEDLAPDISLARELNPSSYEVPIDGHWFFGDLQKFSQIYAQIYAFLYCTKPRFVVNIGDRVKECLRSPWKGGYSRVNLFDALKKAVPSLHDLQIKQIRYASPGEIRIEALKSVGGSISEVVRAYLKNRDPLIDAEKGINMLLASNHLRRSDLSDKSDEQLTMLTAENRKFLVEKGQLISKALNCEEEFMRLSEYSPNIVVSAKVHLALLSRIRRLAEFQSAGLINLG
jgi:hypothetical protein